MTTIEGDWLKDIAVSDLPPMYQEIAVIVGVENAVKLSAHFGGQQVYLLKLDSVLVGQRDKLIRRDRDAGIGYRELARKFNLSEVWVRVICDHSPDENKQGSLFE